MERDGEDDVREGEWCPPEGFGEECSEWEGEILREVVFVGMNDARYERVAKRTRGENAIERGFPPTGMAERTVGRRDGLAVWTVEVGLPWEVPCTTITEERASGSAGKAMEREEEVYTMLEGKHNFRILK